MLSATNFLTLTKYQGVDPEYNTYNGDISSELDEAQLFGVLHAIAVTQPEVKKYIEDNY